ncbi:MAG: hypothetical protein IPK10_11720 [Bacteroidetes bacterium]|nr:hypothetical protein [Bacteroidota bacterium]
MSEIMLLPSAFLQAKFHKTIQKQDSYVIFQNEFPNIDATILNWSSEIRLKWKQDKITFKTKLFHRFKDSGIPLSFLAPKTPLSVYEQLNENWRQQVHKLCDTLLKNVG